MSTTTDKTIDLRTVEPIDLRTGTELGRTEYQRFVEALRDLDDAGWSSPTDCTEWTVRDLAGHVGAMMWSVSKVRRFAREQMQSARRAKAEGLDDPTDAMTAIQVERFAGRTESELVDTMNELIEPAIAGRLRIPGSIARSMRFAVPVGGEPERWSLAYLYGTILTRDTWLHRVADLARAVDDRPEIDADHDGRIVADAAAEWARRHGKPVELTLSGSAGGRFRQGSGGPSIELDAIEFCRMTSGRSEPTHLLLGTAVAW